MYVRNTLAAAFVTLMVGCSTGGVAPEPVLIGPDTPEALVAQAQGDAYNRRDLEAFMSLFAEDAELYEFPDKLLYKGRAQMRPVYAKLFAEATELRSVVTHRLPQGRFVVDRATTTGLPGMGPLTGLEIYEIQDGRILRIWFVD